MVEEWRIIEYAPDYKVSNLGRIKSVGRKVWNGHGYVQKKDKILRPNVIKKGYLQYSLSVNKKRILKLGHRVVADAFLPNPNPELYDQINHIDGNKANNALSNLEWCNNSLNIRHAYRIGLHPKRYRGGNHKKPVKILVSEYLIECESITEASKVIGMRQKTLADALRVSPTIFRNGIFISCDEYELQ